MFHCVDNLLNLKGWNFLLLHVVTIGSASRLFKQRILVKVELSTIPSTSILVSTNLFLLHFGNFDGMQSFDRSDGFAIFIETSTLERTNNLEGDTAYSVLLSSSFELFLELVGSGTHFLVPSSFHCSCPELISVAVFFYRLILSILLCSHHSFERRLSGRTREDREMFRSIPFSFPGFNLWCNLLNRSW